MKIYIASSFSLTARVTRVAAALELLGHEVTVKWWNRTFDVEGEGQIHTQTLKKRYNDLPPDVFYAKPTCSEAYHADYAGIHEADALLLVADDEPRPFNGANVELGMALAWGKPCFSIGSLQNSVMYSPVIRCGYIGEVMDLLKQLEASP